MSVEVSVAFLKPKFKHQQLTKAVKLEKNENTSSSRSCYAMLQLLIVLIPFVTIQRKPWSHVYYYSKRTSQIIFGTPYNHL